MEIKVDSMGTESVRIDSGLVMGVREVKKHVGIPIGRFIEDAIMEKMERLPNDVKSKMIGIKLGKQGDICFKSKVE